MGIENLIPSTTNAADFPWLSVLVFLPLIGGIVAALVPGAHRRTLYTVGLVASGASVVLATVIFARFDQTGAMFQYVDPPDAPWPLLPGGITYQVGVDGISVVLVLLTTFLTFLALLFSLSSVTGRDREYVTLILVLETGLLGVFVALDLFVFYVFWEAVLIPMVLLIGIWGGAGRTYAAVKFVIFTMAGSALMLVAIVVLQSATGSESFHLFDMLRAGGLSSTAQLLLFAAFALAFAVKVPLVPLHTWLPDAHVEAPTAGSVLLAGVLLKMGTYGFVRFAMPIFPDAISIAVPWIVVLGIVGIWYGAWVAFAQDDVKSLVAYSSVSHMGLVMVALFALNVQGMSGGVLQMVNHGISTGALFLLVGMLYDRARTREIVSFGGLWTTMPRYSAIFLLVALSSIGLPGTNGFVGEWLSLLGVFRANMLVGALAAFGVVLGAAYMLWLVQRVFFGPVSETSAKLEDIGVPEMVVLAPLVVLILWIGIYPSTFLGPIQVASQQWLWMIDALAATVMP